MRRKYKLPLAILLLLSLIIIAAFLLLISAQRNSTISKCPEKWLLNYAEDPVKDVLILEGSKMSKENFNINWIYNNCSIVKEIVY